MVWYGNNFKLQRALRKSIATFYKYLKKTLFFENKSLNWLRFKVLKLQDFDVIE